jgi:lipopolysaccharide transport system permease protein
MPAAESAPGRATLVSGAQRRGRLGAQRHELPLKQERSGEEMNPAQVQTYMPQSRSVAYYLRPDHIPRTLWRHRQLIGQLVKRNLLIRYRGSALGLLWSLLLPLIMLAVYTFAFGMVLGAKWGGPADESKVRFALMLFCGLLLFNIFAETATACAGVIVAHANYVKRVVFPLEILPVVALGAALVQGLISSVVLLAGILLFEHHVPATVGYFPLTFIPLLLLCLGLGWFLASLGVYLRDVGQAITVVVQILIFMTPIFYSISILKDHPGLQFAMRMNPLTIVVENARLTVMRGQPPEWLWMGVVSGLSLVLMQLGYAWFMKTKRGFADVI